MKAIKLRKKLNYKKRYMFLFEYYSYDKSIAIRYLSDHFVNELN